MNLLTSSVEELVDAMRDGHISPVDVVHARLDRIEQVNPIVNALVTVRGEEALAEARLAEKRYREGTARPLEGLPFTVKDTIETAGVRTTAGSNLFGDYVPRHDAPSVSRLKSSGGILLGKTNTPEFAMTFATENALFGKTLNPLNRQLTTGGSSGGEAAAIASLCSPMGLGSDLAGSIRVPANFCGVCGLRPTQGRTPSSGHIPLLPDPMRSLSVVGPMSRHVLDLGLLMSVLTDEWESDGHYPWAVRTPPIELTVDSVGYFSSTSANPTSAFVQRSVKSAVEALRQGPGTFARIDELEVPHFDELIALWDEVWSAAGGAAGLLAEYHFQGYQLSRALTKLVAASPPGDRDGLQSAMELIGEIRSEILIFMQEWPLILCPVAVGPPTEVAGRWTVEGHEYRGAAGFGYSYAWSLLGFPALSLSTARGGVQILARPGYDEQAVMLGHTLAADDWAPWLVAGDIPAPTSWEADQRSRVLETWWPAGEPA